MRFELKPGDYIPTSKVPADKRQAVIDAFVAAGCCAPEDIFELGIFSSNFVGWWNSSFKDCNEFSGHSMSGKGTCFTRRVTLKQILGEQSPSWDEVGPELLEATEWLWNFMHGIYENNSHEKYNDTKEAITKARSIK